MEGLGRTTFAPRRKLEAARIGESYFLVALVVKSGIELNTCRCIWI